MENFMQYDFEITKIMIATFVKNGVRHGLHANRQSHGLAFKYSNSTVEYTFSDGKVLIPRENDIFYLPKGSTYTIKDLALDGSCYVINFDLTEDPGFLPFSVHIKDVKGFLDDFKAAERSWTKRNHGYHLKTKSLLYSILYKLQKENQSLYANKAKHDLITPAVSYIHEHYAAETLSISELSKMCSITPEYFRKIFHNIYGISPVKYINNLRLGRAEELLNSGLYSITDVAFLSGYNDISYFNREFKKTHGVSPSEFAKTYRE